MYSYNCVCVCVPVELFQDEQDCFPGASNRVEIQSSLFSFLVWLCFGCSGEEEGFIF